KRFRSTNSLYSSPEPKVPEAVITGFFSSTPASFTLVLLIIPPPCLKIPVRPCRHAYCAHENVRLLPWIGRHRPGRRRYRRPFVPPWKSSRGALFLEHISSGPPASGPGRRQRSLPPLNPVPGSRPEHFL